LVVEETAGSHVAISACDLLTSVPQWLQEHNEALRMALEVKKAELSQAIAAARQNSPPPEAAPAEDRLAEKVTEMEEKAKTLAQQLHSKV